MTQKQESTGYGKWRDGDDTTKGEKQARLQNDEKRQA